MPLSSYDRQSLANAAALATARASDLRAQARTARHGHEVRSLLLAASEAEGVAAWLTGQIDRDDEAQIEATRARVRVAAESTPVWAWTREAR